MALKEKEERRIREKKIITMHNHLTTTPPTPGQVSRRVHVTAFLASCASAGGAEAGSFPRSGHTGGLFHLGRAPVPPGARGGLPVEVCRGVSWA